MNIKEATINVHLADNPSNVDGLDETLMFTKKQVLVADNDLYCGYLHQVVPCVKLSLSHATPPIAAS